MDRDEFCRRSWKAYQTILFKTDRMEHAIDCLIASVDFDREIFMLQPVDTEFYEKDDFAASIKHCEVPRKQFKELKKVN